MMQLVRQPLPDRVSEREACDVLDLCRNSVRAARARYHFMGPASPYRRKRERSSSCQWPFTLTHVWPIKLTHPCSFNPQLFASVDSFHLPA